MLGFLTGRLIWALQWDHIYTADYYLALLALLGASIAACTVTNQWPAAKVARRWRFRGTRDSVAALPQAQLLPAARLADVGAALAARNYQASVCGVCVGRGGVGGSAGCGERAAALARVHHAAAVPPTPLHPPTPTQLPQVFVKGERLYAFKGLAGKLGPIGVHASMLLAMAGFAAGALAGWTGTAMIPEGSDALVTEVGGAALGGG